MQLTKFLVHVFCGLLLLYLCSSAPPPREGKAPASTRGYPFTRQEDELIINELLSNTIHEPRTRDVLKGWKEMSRKIRELHSTRKPGFPQERSDDSLRARFMNVLMKDKSSVRVPPELKQRFLESRVKLQEERERDPAFTPGYPFTPQEDDLIISELLSITINGPRTGHKPKGWKQISRKIHEMHITGKPGFPQDRMEDSIRKRFMNVLMKDKSSVLVPPELKQRIYESKAALHGEKERARTPGFSFTPQEDEFIINELSSTINDRGTGYVPRWRKMSQKHHELHCDGTPGFPQDRSDDTLRNRFTNVLMKDKSSFVRVPPELKQRIHESRAKQVAGTSSLSNPQNEETDPQTTNEQDDQYWAEMVEELCAEPMELDFSSWDMDDR